MSKASDGSICKILMILAQSLYVFYYKRNTLTSTHYLLVTLSVVLLLSFHNYTITYVCIPFDYAYRLLGCVTYCIIS